MPGFVAGRGQVCISFRGHGVGGWRQGQHTHLKGPCDKQHVLVLRAFLNGEFKMPGSLSTADWSGPHTAQLLISEISAAQDGM